MKTVSKFRKGAPARLVHLLGAFTIFLGVVNSGFAAEQTSPSAAQVLDRTGNYVEHFLEDFSSVKCAELVTQIKLKESGKAEYSEDSSFDYLVLNQSSNGELALIESRLADHPPKHTRNLPLLVTNGFSTLLLVFHPSYQTSFEFTPMESEVRNGKSYLRVHFRHVNGTRSTAALLLRGREYPLSLEGDAWVDSESGVIARINAGLVTSMEDVGLRSLQCEVEYEPTNFPGVDHAYWLPITATVDVETPRQHWRNTHRFTAYQRFSTSVESKIGVTR